MKKNLLLCVLLVSGALHAQTTIRLGGDAGPDMTLPYEGTNAAVANSSAAYAFWGGALIEASLKHPDDIFKLQFEVLYNKQYQKINPEGSYYWMKFHQVSMPLTGKIYFSPNASFNFGPVFNFNVAARQKVNMDGAISDTSIGRGYLTSLQGGATLGLSYYFKNGLFVSGRYNQMFGYAIQADNTGGYPLRPRLNYVQVGVGFLFHSFSPDVPGSGY